MQFLVALAVFAGLAASQGLPNCAQGCANQQFGGNGYAGCGIDPHCICANSAFISNIACCLEGACNAADQSSAVAYAQSICSANGVAVPTAVSCTTGATTSSSGAAATTTSSSSGSSGSSSTSSSSVSGVAGGSGSGSPKPTSSSSSSSASVAWAPRVTAAAQLPILGGLVAAAALL